MSDSKNNDKGKDYSSSDMFTVDAKLLQALASLTPEQRELLLRFAQAAKSPSASENSPAPSETPPVQSATPQQTAPKNVSANISLSKSAPPKLRLPSAEPTPPPVLLKSTRGTTSQPLSAEPTPPPVLLPTTNATNQPAPDAEPPVLAIKRRPTRREQREAQIAAANMVDLESDAPIVSPRKETRPEKHVHKERESRRQSSSRAARKSAATFFTGAVAASTPGKADALDSLSALVNAKAKENVSLDSLKLSNAATPTKQASLDSLSKVAAPVVSSSVEDVEKIGRASCRERV